MPSSAFLLRARPMPRRQPGSTHTKSPFFSESPGNATKLRETSEEAEITRLRTHLAAQEVVLGQARKHYASVRLIFKWDGWKASLLKCFLNTLSGLDSRTPRSVRRTIGWTLRHGAAENRARHLRWHCCGSMGRAEPSLNTVPFLSQYYTSPEGARFNSRAAVLRHLAGAAQQGPQNPRRRARESAAGASHTGPSARSNHESTAGPSGKRRKGAADANGQESPAVAGNRAITRSRQAEQPKGVTAPPPVSSVPTSAPEAPHPQAAGEAARSRASRGGPRGRRAAVAVRQESTSGAPPQPAALSPAPPLPPRSPVDFQSFQFSPADAAISPAVTTSSPHGPVGSAQAHNTSSAATREGGTAARSAFPLPCTSGRVAAAGLAGAEAEAATATATVTTPPGPRRVSRFFGISGGEEVVVDDAPRPSQLRELTSAAPEPGAETEAQAGPSARAADPERGALPAARPTRPARPARPPRPELARRTKKIPPEPTPRGEPESWVPPASPWGLVEEQLYSDPWKVLVACVLLNRTTAQQVRGVLWELFTLIPTPEAALCASEEALLAVIRPLGQFYRARTIKRMSAEYLRAEWTRPSELHGIGRYGQDAFDIFCLGRWRETEPLDKDLRRYLDWLRSTGGQGSGLRYDAQPAGAPRVPGLDDAGGGGGGGKNDDDGGMMEEEGRGAAAAASVRSSCLRRRLALDTNNKND